MKHLSHRMMKGFPLVDTSDIADAGHDQVKVMDFGINAVHPSMKVAGPVYTIDQPGGSNLSIFEGIAAAPPGSVLVINAHSYMQSGHLGSLVVMACQLRQIAGIVIDGAIRDVPDIIKMGFPVFARGSVSRGNSYQTGSLNQPIQCGGIAVMPDDMVFADATGVVVFPQAQAHTFYEKAVAITIAEMGFKQQISEGKNILEIPEFLKIHGLLKSTS